MRSLAPGSAEAHRLKLRGLEKALAKKPNGIKEFLRHQGTIVTKYTTVVTKRLTKHLSGGNARRMTANCGKNLSDIRRAD